MSSAKLEKIGVSVMVEIPPAVLEHLRLQSGETVDVAVDAGCIRITPSPHRRYSLADLLEEHHAAAPQTSEQEWTNSDARGRELI